MSRKQTAEDKIAKVLDSYHAYLKEWKYDEKKSLFSSGGWVFKGKNHTAHEMNSKILARRNQDVQKILKITSESNAGTGDTSLSAQ
ncbi:hypothetical protein ACR3H8_30150 [Pseudomonas aeruginosa]|uniref:Uncharacterized protein n=4 Tax=Pseudomonas TaxID=286 RepID=A0A223Q461_PSEPU|nr:MULTISPECIES: hypothetical protein [Pseudomonas]WQN30310.1 hypothetical protein ULE26_22330 [Stutzerimonas stutzeri]AJA17218.1 hypothetical protein RPPX_28240 [Pseudomonas putida S12]ANI18844.1 hypothetical protein A9C11_32850 [Pseudomonas citronellolis]ANP63401.1 hypothetical protein A9P90_31600 [Pseudomonas aeruginosa]ARD70485.1 Hypothetical protein [Pseudomonas aeruginosa]